MPIQSKHIKKLMALLSLCFLTGCSSPSFTKDDSVTITFVNNDCVSLSNKALKVKKGDDLNVSLTFKEDYIFDSCSYADYEFENSKNLLTLNDVTYPQRVEIYTVPSDMVIHYHANGGNGDFEESYASKYHKRINTAIGIDKLKRDGYYLKEWNTSNDGNGISIGLGSRTNRQPSLDLYAIWEKEESLTSFEYSAYSDGIAITKYLGESQNSLVLPSYINGRKVTKIDKGFASNLSFDHIYLPQYLKEIDDNAFVNVSLKEITMGDAIRECSSSAFGHTIKTWNINAVEAPRFQNQVDHVQFTDDMDRLMLNESKKKMVFFAGCSMSYGLNSKNIAKEFPDYFVQDMGVIGGTNAYFQFQCIEKYMHDSDIFVHAPEICSTYQLMDDISAEWRMFTMVEGNYDLLKLVDCSRISAMFDAWKIYGENKDKLPEGKYSDTISNFNEYGDYSVNRVNYGGNTKYSVTSYWFTPELQNESSVKELNNVYEMFNSRGAKVLFSFSPVNYDSLPADQINGEAYKTYENFYRTNLNSSYATVISDSSEYIFRGSSFYDEDYHLTSAGANERTSTLIQDIKNYLSNA